MSRPLKYTLAFGCGGSVVMIGIAAFVRKVIHQELLEDSPTSDQARDIFYKNKTAKAILGTPIKEYHLDTWNGEINYDNDYECQCNFPVKGTNISGHLHYKAIRNMVTGDWTITTLSLKSEDLQTTLYSIIPPQE